MEILTLAPKTSCLATKLAAHFAKARSLSSLEIFKDFCLSFQTVLIFSPVQMGQSNKM